VVGPLCGSSTREITAVTDVNLVLSYDMSGCPALAPHLALITAGNRFVVAETGDATFTGGSWIALADGFSIESGGTFTAAFDAALTPFAWVQDDITSWR